MTQVEERNLKRAIKCSSKPGVPHGLSRKGVRIAHPSNQKKNTPHNPSGAYLETGENNEKDRKTI